MQIGVLVWLFVGDDWAEDHHDVEVMDEAGAVLARRRLPEGVSGMGQLHELVGGLLGGQAGASEVRAGTETDHGPWVMALIAAGYRGLPGQPAAAGPVPGPARGCRGAKSDARDAHVLADMVRTDSHQLRAAAGDSPQAEGVKVLARTHKTMIWERTREVQRLRHQLREYFPAAVYACFGSGEALFDAVLRSRLAVRAAGGPLLPEMISRPPRLDGVAGQARLARHRAAVAMAAGAGSRNLPSA